MTARRRPSRRRQPQTSIELEVQTGTTTTGLDALASRSQRGTSEPCAAGARAAPTGVAAGAAARTGRPLDHHHVGPLAPLVGDVAFYLSTHVLSEKVDGLSGVGHLHEAVGTGRRPEFRTLHAVACSSAAHAGRQRQSGPNLETPGTARDSGRLNDVKRLPVGNEYLVVPDRLHGHRDLIATGSSGGP